MQLDDAIETGKLAFEELMIRHFRAVEQVVRAILGDSPEVEDVVQTTFLRAYACLEQLSDKAKFKYWLRAIAANEAKTVARHAVEERSSKLLTLPERHPDPSPADRAEASALVSALTRRLPKKYLQVLFLRYALEYSVEEVSELLKVDPGLVKWRSSVGRRMASKILGEE